MIGNHINNRSTSRSSSSRSSSRSRSRSPIKSRSPSQADSPLSAHSSPISSLSSLSSYSPLSSKSISKSSSRSGFASSESCFSDNYPDQSKDSQTKPYFIGDCVTQLTDLPQETYLTDDYLNQLIRLQQRIMTLRNNDDLQRVVQVISETGQFEITQRTFDFDLCALHPSTIKQLQDMLLLKPDHSNSTHSPSEQIESFTG